MTCSFVYQHSILLRVDIQKRILLLLKLEIYLNFTLSSDDVNFTAEVSNYQIDVSLKVITSVDHLDTCWNYILLARKMKHRLV